MKVDLHLHSKHSKRPSQWFLQKIGCPESFSEPDYLYRTAFKKGMTGFTLTDHNTIDGCLELAGRPGVFISEEVTTYFPEDGCKAHVLVWNIDSEIHEKIQSVRENIFDLAAYLQQNDLPHALAHPLFSINDKLTVAHFEKFLLLFKTMEMNGARDEYNNRLLRAVFGNLTPEVIDRLRRKHKIMPAFMEPWVKFTVGGSDDHSALNMIRLFTQVPGARTLPEFFKGLKEGRSKPVGTGSGPRTMAHNIYGIAYQFYDHKLDIKRFSGYNVMVSLVDRLLNPQPRRGSKLVNRLKGFWGRHRPGDNGKGVHDLLRRESENLILEDPALRALAEGRMDTLRQKGTNWFDFVTRISDKTLDRCVSDLDQRFFQANPFSLLPSLSSVGVVYFLLAPYFVAYNLYGRDRHLDAKVMEEFDTGDFRPKNQDARPKTAIFTDSYYDNSRTAELIRGQVEEARNRGENVTVITCHPDAPDWVDNIRHFRPVGVYGAPEKPEQKLYIPSVLSILDEVFRLEFTRIHALTPGPIGMVAALVARVLDLPLYGTYQPNVHQEISRITGDETMEQLVWRFFTWYYNRMDMVLVPSVESVHELETKGVGPERIRIFPGAHSPDWMDTDRTGTHGSH